jgi:N-methylhydantoinase A
MAEDNPNADRPAATWRVGVDIGGTFTDFVILTPESRLERIKLLSTPDDYSRAITSGLKDGMSDAARAGVDAFVHGTTVATNAILEETTQKIGLITTRGFRDVLELRRARRPHLYELNWEPPHPLAGRALRLEVSERMDAAGNVIEPLDESGIDRAIETLRNEGVAAVAVCLLNAYANPTHERRVAERVAAALPGVKVTWSAMLAPEPREYERTSTTVVNAFLLPVVHDYLTRLERSLREIGVTPQPQVMQSDGTTANATLVRERPFLIIESGPAAGVVAAARLAEEMGRPAVIAFDMGGTTAKACLVKDHRVALNEELEVGDSINRGGGHSRGAGYVVRAACVDLTEVGSGGGSIAWVDGGGSLRVGPKSSGANPGPACYGQGGKDATVTDAHVVLGYLNPDAIAGGKKRIHRELAHEAMAVLAKKLNVSERDAAYGIFSVATAAMRRAVRAVSVERGYDPRRFTLVSFGGAGGLHAAALAADLEMPEVAVPIAPGLFSSLGLLFSDVAVTRVASRRIELNAAALGVIDGDIAERATDATAELERHHRLDARPDIEAVLSLQYIGQSATLTVPMTATGSDAERAAALTAAFHAEHRLARGHAAEDQAIEVTAIRVRVVARAPKMRFADLAGSFVTAPAGWTPQARAREMYFGPKDGAHLTRVVARHELSARALAGPLLIEEPESTIVVPPGFDARLHETGSVLIRPIAA